MKSAFYGIIPKTILHHQKLKANSKLIYAEIIACLEDDGTCIKRNIYFSNVLNISKDTASRSIAELRNYGLVYVQTILEKGTEKFIKRCITPMQNFLWVNQNSDNPYMQNNLGVSDILRGDDALTYIQNTQTLLSNNNISKIYTDGNKPITPINKNINAEQLIALRNVSSNFLHKQKKRFPHLFEGKDETDLLNKSINTLYDLIKLDKVNYNVVCDVLDYTLGDKFWHSQVTSLHTLRHKSNNGNIKFHNILTAYNTRGGKV